MPNTPNTHESFSSRTSVTVGSERSFGLVFAAVFALIALAPLLDGALIQLWALVVAAGFALIAFIYPILLRPLNLIWFKFGLLLHKIVNPIIMGLLFYVTIMPIGLIMRLCGKDLLNLRIDKNTPSYWIKREPHESDSMRNQF
ncbi:MAG: hypothetical protein JKY20_00535 [Alphaproteobacteria bacterium]|nr:hypothetical protein [Alphaproteobacteria bacterium]